MEIPVADLHARPAGSSAPDWVQGRLEAAGVVVGRGHLWCSMSDDQTVMVYDWLDLEAPRD